VIAAISVLQKKLKSIRMMSQEVSWPEYQKMRSIPYSSTHWDDEVKRSSIADASESRVAPTSPKESTTPLLPYRVTKEIA
jgi:hypothetical protein